MLKILFTVLVSILVSGVFTASFAEGEKGEHHHMKGMADKSMGKRMDRSMRKSGGSGICPVLGGTAVEKYSYEYGGKTYYFCCEGCVEEFKKDPKKYISKIKEIDLAAYQFGFSPEEIVVNKGDIVRLSVTSKDVPHGVYIKEYGVNTQVKKGEIEKIEFVADKSGEFDVICSIYCGRGHHNMRAKLIVKE